MKLCTIVHSVYYIYMILGLVICSSFERKLFDRQQARSRIKMEDTMTSGELATKAKVNKETLRFYERKQLLRLPNRTDGGYRNYLVEDLRRVQFIKNAQMLGFSLEEVRELLALADAEIIDKEDVRMIATNKVEKIGHQIRNLRRLEKVLKGLITKCANSEATHDCPIIGSLSGSQISTILDKDRRRAI